MLKFLIDNGADISLCKQNVIDFSQDSLFREDINISGIGNGVLKTLGSVNINVSLDDHASIHIPFYVVDKNFPISADGII